MKYEIREQQLASVPLAVVHRQAGASELSRIIPECCGLVWNVLRGQGIHGGRHIAVYWDDSVRLEVGVELAVPFIEEAGVVRSATPTGPTVSTTHLGPYGELSAAHHAIHQWAKTNDRRLAGPRWEIYGHWQPEWDNDPSQIRTDVHYLLSSAR